ncbi:hypothetical protein WN48_00014 [Eufriesea mexicana]|uniref:Uncharacterized protein n=1 Tax=Eufriesea mexicana TaxID=516756 RepID=A0A310SH82_9HYME|nr:hypothetical protein WN48_00014 [Eufriesea mexicana]
MARVKLPKGRATGWRLPRVERNTRGNIVVKQKQWAAEGTKLWSVGVANRVATFIDSHSDERKIADRASVRTQTIVYEARSDAVTLSDRLVVRQVDCNGGARSDDLRGHFRKKLNVSVLPPALNAYAQKTEVYYSALQTTYRLSTISCEFIDNFTAILLVVVKEKVWADREKKPRSTGETSPGRELSLVFSCLGLGILKPESRCQGTKAIGTQCEVLKQMFQNGHLSRGRFSVNRARPALTSFCDDGCLNNLGPYAYRLKGDLLILTKVHPRGDQVIRSIHKSRDADNKDIKQSPLILGHAVLGPQHT